MPTRPDVFAFHAIQAGRLVVDTTAGTIATPTGHRAELVDRRTGYGRVTVNTTPLVYAMAHRMVWMAAHGLIIGRAQVRHLNDLRWDNRLANLFLDNGTGVPWYLDRAEPTTEDDRGVAALMSQPEVHRGRTAVWAQFT